MRVYLRLFVFSSQLRRYVDVHINDVSFLICYYVVMSFCYKCEPGRLK